MAVTMDLSDIRKDIDKIDSELVRLILRRMECSRKVAEYKSKNGMPVFDAVREKQILDSLAAKDEQHAEAIRMIYSAIMEQSKALQYPYVENTAVREFSVGKPHGEVKSVACQGIAGAYASLVAKRLYPNAKIAYYPTFAGVCSAVGDGKAEYGILPVENSWAGSVHEVYDLLISGKFSITECVDAKILHHLIGTPDANESDIERILSHPQALKQCAEMIDRLGCTPVDCSNTAVAVKTVSELGDRHTAAIGSSEAAKLYGMKILCHSIATSSVNTTRFVSISSKAEKCEDADKVSIVFSVNGAKRSGTLVAVLEHFASCGMSLTKIESRPLKGSQFEYKFYADFMGNLDDRRVAGVLATLAKELPDFILLGNYRESAIELN